MAGTAAIRNHEGSLPGANIVTSRMTQQKNEKKKQKNPWVFDDVIKLEWINPP